MHEFIAILVAIAVTALLGLGVGRIMEIVVPKPERHEGIDNVVWTAMDWRVHTGSWIGSLERLIALIAFWIPAHAVIAAWLAFKVAAKWEAWKNIIQVPDNLEGVPQVAWYQARVSYGSWLHSRFLVGALLNVLIGAVGAYAGQHLWEFVGWLCSGRLGA